MLSLCWAHTPLHSDLVLRVVRRVHFDLQGILGARHIIILLTASLTLPFVCLAALLVRFLRMEQTAFVDCEALMLLVRALCVLCAVLRGAL
jgi:hypothetical protein